MSTDLYLDYNGSTPVDPEVLEVYRSYSRSGFGNAAATHPEGRKAREAIDRARQRIASGLGSSADEIWFTSGGTESNNWAITGSARACKGKHIVISAIEHKSVLRPAEELAALGWGVTVLPVAPRGAVELDRVRAALRGDTCLVSVMMANNETGVLQPVEGIGALCRERGIRFHCDAVAAVGKIPVDVGRIGCDLLSISAHKLYAPKGCGVLYVRQGVELAPLITGCGQQCAMRSGSENTPAVAALGKAFERMAGGAFRGVVSSAELCDALWRGIRERFPGAAQNGDGARLPNTLSVWFPQCRGFDLQALLGEAGISVSAGAAALGSAPSHVLLAMGLGEERARSTVRFSFGAESVSLTVDTALRALELAVPRCRVSTSPHPAWA